MSKHRYCISTNEYNKFKSIFPSGVNSPLRSFSEVDVQPPIIVHSSGSSIVDIDGNTYIDFINGLGSLILGHSNSVVCEAVKAQLNNGTIFSCCHRLEYEHGKPIVDSTDFIEKLRFVCSGTEAVMGVIRVARAFTNKEIIIRFTGSYHGHADAVYYRSEANVDDWREKGLTNEMSNYTLTCKYDDISSIEETFKNVDNIAAVIIEPVASNMGLKIPSFQFLKRLRELCDEHKSLLIFDEVVAGFRFCFGSVSKILNVTPDLVVFGKIIGGGLPVGCFAGKSDVMDIVEKLSGYFQGGTFAANPLTCTAGSTVLDILASGDIYTDLENKGKLFEEVVTSKNTNRIKIETVRLGSLITLIPKVFDSGNFTAVNWDILFREIYSELMQKGVLLPPSIYEPIFISAAHSNSDITDAATVVRDAIIRKI